MPPDAHSVEPARERTACPSGESRASEWGIFGQSFQQPARVYEVYQKAMRDLHVQVRPLDSLIPYARNARTHSDAQVAQIAGSIREFGWTNPVLVDGQNGIIAGHGRVLAARVLGMPDVPVIELADLTDAQRRAYVLADNKLAERAGWDDALLRLELGELRDDGFNLDLIGFDALELGDLLDLDADTGQPGHSPTLADRFMIAPFSVLDARRGWWTDRKRAWIDMGIDPGDGRAALLTFSKSAQPPAAYAAKNLHEARLGRVVTWAEFEQAHPDAMQQSGTSVFDPVLCELAYRWFSPVGGLVVDPFAGGSVRGIVAAKTGRRYLGLDLRAEQVEANRVQADKVCAGGIVPRWVCADSRTLGSGPEKEQADFVFSCPPYADLEVYSDDPADLSTMAYPQFVDAYRDIIRRAVGLLKADRFACFVVGEVRGKDGTYLGFVRDTVAAFEDAGARFYNEAILITPAGSLAIRAGKAFSTSRKLGKTHQNILVFVKGDARRATEACGQVDVGDDLFEAEAVE